jgi:hypothetical protein
VAPGKIEKVSSCLPINHTPSLLLKSESKQLVLYETNNIGSLINWDLLCFLLLPGGLIYKDHIWTWYNTERINEKKEDILNYILGKIRRGTGESRHHMKWFKIIFPNKIYYCYKKTEEGFFLFHLPQFYWCISVICKKWGSLASASFPLIPLVIIASLYSHLYKCFGRHLLLHKLKSWNLILPKGLYENTSNIFIWMSKFVNH